MENEILNSKTFIIANNEYEQDTSYFQINFFDALSSLYYYLGEDALSCVTEEHIMQEIDYIKNLIDKAVNSNEKFICLYRNDGLYYKILEGLKIRIERAIY